MWDAKNEFLNGPFSPWTEESEDYDLEVIGKIPEDLNGALFRISSNPRFQPRNTDRYHWWEGDGMVCGVYVRDGKAAYRTRWVETDSMKVEMQQGEAVYSGFVNGGTPGKLPAGAPKAKNVANTNVGIFDNRLLTYFEGGLPYQMHPESLKTYGTHDFHGGIKVLCTAHYKIDPATGDMLFFAATGPVVTWFRADKNTGRIIDTHSIEIGVPALLHDFIVSANYAIWFITPSLFRTDLIAKGLPGVVWDEGALPNGTRIVMMDRRTHEVKWYETSGMFSPTHYFNAYEIGDEVVIDLHSISRLGNPFGKSKTPAGAHPSPTQWTVEVTSSHEWFPPALPWQWRVNVKTCKVADRMVSGTAGEFPKINDAYLGREYRYGYFVTTRGLASDTMTDGLAKHDYLTDSTCGVEGLDGLTSPSEPVFVARRNARSEDDGYLLALWWNRETDLSEMLVHDAADLRRTPLARVKLRSRVPNGFHGSWAGQEVLEKSIAAQRSA